MDREERPDVDAVYMAVCQMLTRRGSWPLTILMTPDKKPFFAAEEICQPVLQQAYHMIRTDYDPRYGGFDPAPKFPTPHRLSFLLRHFHRTGDENSLNMVRHTLEAMRCGGMVLKSALYESERSVNF